MDLAGTVSSAELDYWLGSLMVWWTGWDGSWDRVCNAARQAGGKQSWPQDCSIRIIGRRSKRSLTQLSLSPKV